MANKREFKKQTHALTAAVVNDMMASSFVSDKIDKEAIDNAIIKLLSASEAAIVKVNVKFDKTMKAFDSEKEYKKAKKSFYKTLFDKAGDEFIEKLKEAMADYNACFPSEVKDELKADATK